MNNKYKSVLGSWFICRDESRIFFFIGGFLTKGWGILAVRIDETLSKLIVSNLPDHIWLLYVVCRTGDIFSRFTDERRPARSDWGAL